MNGKNYIDYVYWGKPATIQIDKATKWVTKETPFSLKTVPKRLRRNALRLKGAMKPSEYIHCRMAQKNK